jgi:hypothetical protein
VRGQDNSPRYAGRVPLLLALLVAVLVAVPLFALLLPLSLFQRYRAGTARRAARGWVAALNVGILTFSTALFLTGAAVTSLWFPRALPFALAGLAAGLVLGLLGLALSRWESAPGTLHVTPNRWLVLLVVGVVAGRMAWGAFRSLHVLRSGAGTGVVAAFGPAESLGAGALVVGYYLAYWAGVLLRARRHRAAGL